MGTVELPDWYVSAQDVAGSKFYSQFENYYVIHHAVFESFGYETVVCYRSGSDDASREDYILLYVKGSPVTIFRKHLTVG